MKSVGLESSGVEHASRVKKRVGILVISIVVVCAVGAVFAGSSGKSHSQNSEFLRQVEEEALSRKRMEPEKKACMKKLSENTHQVRADVKTGKPDRNGGVTFESAQESAVDVGKVLSSLSMEKSTVMMVGGHGVRHDHLVVIADKTKVVVELPSCTVTTVVVGEAESRGEREKVRANSHNWYEKKWNNDDRFACWKDLQYHSERVMRDIWDKVIMSDSNSMTPSVCQNTCAGYKYAGLEFGRECFCGTRMRYQLLGANQECNHGCSGASSTSCGGYARMIIYQDGNYQSKCLRMRHFHGYTAFEDKEKRESIGFYQSGCSISANIWRWNGHGYYLTKAFIGHMVNDWNELILTLETGETWKAYVYGDNIYGITSMTWTQGAWYGKGFWLYN